LIERKKHLNKSLGLMARLKLFGISVWAGIVWHNSWAGLVWHMANVNKLSDCHTNQVGGGNIRVLAGMGMA